MMDALVRNILEVRRPADKIWQGWIDRQNRALTRAFDALEQETFPPAFTIDQVSIITAIGYLEFRFPEFKWRDAHPKLAAWAAKVSERKSVKETNPK